MPVKEGGHRFIQTGHWTQFRIPVRVWQKAHVKDVIGIDRDTVLKAEGFEDHGQFAFSFTQQPGAQHFRQLVNRHLRGIDNQIGPRAQGLQQIALFIDGAFQRQILARQRMQATGVAVSTDQRVAIGIEKQQLRRKALRQVFHRLLEDLR